MRIHPTASRRLRAPRALARPLARTLSLALLASSLAATSCSRKPEFLGQAVIGFYRGEYGNAAEQLELRPDATFVQELRIGNEVAYRNEGTWRVTGTDIAFDQFYRAVDPASGKVAKPTEKSSTVRGFWLGTWRTYDDARFEIVFDPRTAYRIKKVDDSGPLTAGDSRQASVQKRSRPRGAE